MSGSPRLPTGPEVRAWETANRKGHAAAAEHFRALGYDVDEDAIRELYRQPMAPKPKPAPAPPKPKPAKSTPEPPPVPAPPPTTAIATVAQPHPADRDELDDLRLQYDLLWTMFKAASPRDAAPISRQMQQIRARLNEVEALRKAASSKGLTTEGRLRAMGERMEAWPDGALEVPVRIYLRRHGLRLWREDSGVVDVQTAENREEAEE